MVRSVRDSLGLNYSQEISLLRDRLDRLESLLVNPRPTGVVGSAGYLSAPSNAIAGHFTGENGSAYEVR